LSEAGDPNVSNKKYNAIKKIVNKYLPDPGIPIPPPTPKHAYGKIQMTKVSRSEHIITYWIAVMQWKMQQWTNINEPFQIHIFK
jgi:hypothetical protein